MNECVLCGSHTPNEFEFCDDCEKRLMENTINTLASNLQSTYAENRYFNGDIIDPDPDRMISIQGTIKKADVNELKHDALDFFVKQKKELEKDFKERMVQEIGEKKTQEFINILVNYWYPPGKRGGKKINELKCIVRDYFNTFGGTPSVRNDCTYVKTRTLQLQPSDIKEIIAINRDMVNLYLNRWLESFWDKSTNYIYFRRGLHLKQVPHTYKENDYISSYTLAISVSEQFSTMKTDGCYIVSGEYGLFDDRILFFSPFIEGMPAEQLEIGIIPNIDELYLKKEDIKGVISELILSETP